MLITSKEKQKDAIHVEREGNTMGAATENGEVLKGEEGVVVEIKKGAGKQTKSATCCHPIPFDFYPETRRWKRRN